MAHLILELDSAIRPASAPQSWHKLEKVSDTEITQASDIPNIAYPIVKEARILPANYVFSGSNCSFDIVAKTPSNNVVLAPCSDEYMPIGNDEILDRVFEAFQLHGIPAKFSFGLTMDNCKKVSYAFQIENAKDFFVNGTDKHELFINVASSHDKTLGLKISGSAIRVVCYNTLQFALRSEKQLLNYTFFHGEKGYNDFKNLPNIIEASLLHASLYSALAEKMGNRVLSMHQAKAIALQMLANGENEVGTKAVNSANEIGELFATGKGNKGENLYDFFNGVTEYYTSGNGSGKTVSTFKKAVSADFGSAAKMKADILYKLQTPSGDLISDAELDAIIIQGNLLLNSYSAKKADKELANA